MPQLNQGRTRADKAARQKNRPVKNTAQVRDTTNTGLAEISLKIKALEKKSIANVVEIGRLLSVAADRCEGEHHGEFMPWLKREFGWSHETSLNFRRVYDLSQNPKISDFDKLDISISALYLVAKLVRDSETNDMAQLAYEAILEAAKQGRVTYQMTTAIIEAARVAADDRHHAEQERIQQLFFDYGERFGYAYGVHLDDNICRLMEAALRSGVDEPELVQKKREAEEYRAEYERKHAEFLVTPIRAETEQEYTGRIKNRKLYDGACELAWEQYFIFRDQHPECEPLTENDLAYLAQWTPCAIRPKPEPAPAVEEVGPFTMTGGGVEIVPAGPVTIEDIKVVPVGPVTITGGGVKTVPSETRTTILFEAPRAQDLEAVPPDRRAKDKTVSVQELKEKLTPIIKELMIQGNKDMATVSFSAILRQAGLLKNLLEEWTSTAKATG